MKFLESLYLNNNAFSGELDFLHSSLLNLEECDATSNKFEGDLNVGKIKDMPKMTTLLLRNNRLSGPPNINLTLPKLRFLDLSSNAFRFELRIGN